MKTDFYYQENSTAGLPDRQPLPEPLAPQVPETGPLVWRVTGKPEAQLHKVCFTGFLVIKILASLLVSVHSQMSLGQNKSKASVLECPWSPSDCVNESGTLLRESVPTRETTLCAGQGMFRDLGSFKDPESAESSWLVGTSLCRRDET